MLYPQYNKVYAISFIWIEIQMQQVNGASMYFVFIEQEIPDFPLRAENGIYKIIGHYQQSLTAGSVRFTQSC